jgi:hypothetical protein
VVSFLSQYFQTPIFITSNAADLSEGRININYTSDNNIPHSIWIKPAGLLFEKGIHTISLHCVQHTNGYTAFFTGNGIMGFDVLSAIFYLITRYEEYLPHQKDMYGRYAHQNSCAYKENFLHQPLINIWLEDLRQMLQNTGNCQLPDAKFSFSPTYDIDMAWSYSNKGILRNAGGFGKSFLQRDWTGIKERALVLAGIRPDPYDAFEWMDAVHKKYDLSPAYFFHVGQKRNRYDKNIRTTNNDFQKLIKQTAEKYSVGLHPSWHSGDAKDYLGIEKAVLEELTGSVITASRQHYIRFQLPTTFRLLTAAGIKEDYSMGYATINGFRASVASPFYWYDLEKEEQTSLVVYPFCYMDANSFFELNHTPQQALEEMLHYYTVVKNVKGTLCTLWHNTYLGTDKLFRGWREVYETFLQKVEKDGLS